MSNFAFDASKHDIKAVTIFSSSKAEVTRTFLAELKKGQNEVKITKLPSCIDLDTARLSGLGDAVLFDVVCSLEDQPPKPREMSDELEELQRRHAALSGERRVRQHEADILVNFGKTLHAENNCLDDFTSFLGTFVAQGRANLQAVSDIEAQISSLEKKIEEEKQHIAVADKQAPTHGRVTAVITAQKDVKVELILTYMVRDAEWKPSYDLRAVTEGGKPSQNLSLHYRASITQHTGEDWRNTALTLSTASPGWALKLPELYPLKVVPNNLFGPPPRQTLSEQNSVAVAFSLNRAAQNNAPVLFGAAGPQAQQAPSRAFGASNQAALSGAVQQQQQAPQALSGSFGGFGEAAQSVGGAGLFSAAPPAPAPSENYAPGEAQESSAPDALGETGTVVTEGAVASCYHIEGSCTVPSDGDTHKVTVAVLPFSARVHYVTAPRVRPIVFLQCEVTNSSDYRLLPGPVNVFLDNSPVSKTTIADVNPEETFQCTLGPDPALRISYTRHPRLVETTKSAFAAHTTNYTYKTTTVLQNKHTFSVRNFVLRDVVPMSEQASIQVILKEPKGLAVAKDGEEVAVAGAKGAKMRARWTKGADGKKGDTEGKFEWIVDVDAGGEVSFESEYEVRAPTEFNWSVR